MIDLQSMGKRIRELRRSAKLTQEKFALQINISTSYLALIEMGKRMASIDVLAQIVDSYHVSLDYLLFGKDEDLDETKSHLIFQDLCSKYSEQEILSGLKLMEYYLKNRLQ